MGGECSTHSATLTGFCMAVSGRVVVGLVGGFTTRGNICVDCDQDEASKVLVLIRLVSSFVQARPKVH